MTRRNGTIFSFFLTGFFSYLVLRLGYPTMAAAADEPAAQPVQAEAVDINSASEALLMKLPHITLGLALRIIRRPYQDAQELVARQIIPEDIYDKIKDQIMVRAPKKK